MLGVDGQARAATQQPTSGLRAQWVPVLGCAQTGMTPRVTSAKATPTTYVWKGRQYVVIAAGGHAKSDTRRGDKLVAFALPQ